MDQIVYNRLSSFNFNNQQKKDLVEIIKYIAKYNVEWEGVEEIKRLIEFCGKYKIGEDGIFPDFDEYISKFNTLNKELAIYIETHKKELENYVRKDSYPESDINILIEFLKKYEIKEDGTFTDFNNYVATFNEFLVDYNEHLSKFEELNTAFVNYVVQHTEELKQYVKTETIDALKEDINNQFSAMNTTIEDFNFLIESIQQNINNLKHVPDGGKEGQFLVADANGNPIWRDHNATPSITDSAYGIEWEKGSSTVYRIGNMNLHRTCPIQNRLKGCLHDGKKILHWLNPDGWGLPMDNGEIPVLDGSAGDVGVAMPVEYFVKVVDLDTKYQIWISDYNLDGTWVRISPCIYSANKTLTRINSEGLEEAFNACLGDNDTWHVGGDRTTTTHYASLLHGRPRTNISLLDAIQVCKNRNNGIRVINYLHHCSLQLLFYIEYANFNSQATVNKELTSGGYKQGGLGNGIVNIDNSSWITYNNANPILDTYFQVKNNIGNKSYCDVAFNGNNNGVTFSVVPAYFHGIHIFGDIFGFVSDILVRTDPDDSTHSIVYKLNENVDINDVTINNIETLCTRIGKGVETSNLINEFDLTQGPYFIPSDVSQNSKYDTNYVNRLGSNNIRILLVDGGCYIANSGGIGYFNAAWSVNHVKSELGFSTITPLD